MVNFHRKIAFIAAICLLSTALGVLAQDETLSLSEARVPITAENAATLVELDRVDGDTNFDEANGIAAISYPLPPGPTAIQLFDLVGGSDVSPTRLPAGMVFDLEFADHAETPQVGALMIDGEDFVLRFHLWDVITGTEIVVMDVVDERYGFALSPDGTRVALATGTFFDATSGDVNVYETQTQSLLWSGTFEGGLKAIVFSPDSNLLAIGHGSSVTLYDAATGEEQSKLSENVHGHNEVIVFSPDGAMLAIGAIENPEVPEEGPFFIELWNVEEGSLITTIPTEGSVQGLGFNSDGTLLAGGLGAYYSPQEGKEGLYIWSIPDGSVLWEQEQSASAVEFSSDDTLLITSLGSAITQFWGVPQE